MLNLSLVAGLLLLATIVGSLKAKGEWPLPAHDNKLSARAEVPCNMPTAPKEVWAYDLGQVPTRFAMCADVDDDGKEEVLYGPGPLICVDLFGKEKWRCGCGEVLAVADMDGDGATEIVVDGPQIVRAKDGKVLWTRTGPGSVGRNRIHVGKLLPEVKGLQIACVSEKYELNQAQVWSFAQGCERAKLEWEREFSKGPVYAHCTSSAGRFDQKTMCVAAAVHGGLAVMDARDGKDLFRFYWQPQKGEGLVRNYGALCIKDLDGDGRSEFLILNDLIAVQLGVFSPARAGAGEASDQTKPYPAPEVGLSELASYPEGPILWRRYFGEWFPQGAYTLHVPPTAVADVDGDGKQEIVVSVHRESWQLKVYDALTGNQKLSAPDLYVHAVTDLDGDETPEIIAAREASRTPREFTTLVIGNLHDGKWLERLRLNNCRMEYSATTFWPLGMAGRNSDPRTPFVVEDRKGKSLVVTQSTSGDGRADKALLLRARSGRKLTSAGFSLDKVADVRIASCGSRCLVAIGQDAILRLLSLDGKVVASWASGRPGAGGPAVADIDGDGANEILLCRANRRVIALHGPFVANEQPRELWSADGWGFPAPSAYGPMPLAADVNGDGRKEVLVACLTPNGGVGCQLLDGHGRTLWKTSIPGAVDTPLYGAITRATVGDFNGDGRLEVYVSARMAMTGNDASQSFALEGQTGRILWHNDGSAKVIWHHTLGPTGLPAVADVNEDGLEDVLFVTLDLCTELSGKDGSFLHDPLIANGLWNQANKSTQWTAYGTQLPVDLNGDGKLEVLECASWGQWGAWTMDRRFLWTFDPGRDQHSNRHPGLGDVDGDGRLEIGALHNGGFFRCYDAATGTLKWELQGVRQWTDVVTADVDNDGRPEFIAGGSALAAIKALNEKSGKVLWEVPVPGGARSPAIADIDGDGFGEIVVGCGDGKVRVYK